MDESSLPESESAREQGWCRVDRHRYRIEDDTIHWQFAVESIFARYGYCLSLINAGHVAKVTPEARRFLGQQSKRRNQKSAAAIFNSGVIATAVSLLIAGAFRIFIGKEPTFAIFKTEAEARSWLVRQRQQIRQ